VSVIEAMQAALAAEHAVIFGYGVAGAHLAGAELAAAREADTAHRDRRDALAAAIRGRGAAPVTAEPAYRLPFPVTGRVHAVTLATTLEEGAAAAWRSLVAAADGAELRGSAVAALTDAAVRATRWRRRYDPAHAAVPFPGQPA
jgi:Domain of unknown function (DUF4439)